MRVFSLDIEWARSLLETGPAQTWGEDVWGRTAGSAAKPTRDLQVVDPLAGN